MVSKAARLAVIMLSLYLYQIKFECLSNACKVLYLLAVGTAFVFIVQSNKEELDVSRLPEQTMEILYGTDMFRFRRMAVYYMMGIIFLMYQLTICYSHTWNPLTFAMYLLLVQLSFTNWRLGNYRRKQSLKQEQHW